MYKSDILYKIVNVYTYLVRVDKSIYFSYFLSNVETALSKYRPRSMQLMLELIYRHIVIYIDTYLYNL